MTADDAVQWFAMRDLKRRNARQPAYKMLDEMGIDCFTPMTHRLVTVMGHREDREVPFMPDILFVRTTRAQLDPIVAGTATLQYRYKLGAQHTPIVVRSTDMERFINAVRSASGTQYFRPDEITPAMTRRPIRIIGGRLDGYTGTLVTTRGSKAKRLLVELPGFLAAAVEVEAEYIQLLPARKD